ncbi:unnamed protein product [Heligmosomoides polygyrus]|uniref:Uncharacterized protein n=1 Tax=Heligmosomoides polygyrus TaxID=6339 RepID=A0A183G6Z2_HELPZ|nr:unnamed protein product [Heligmosomoides polygyrus]
MAAGVFGTTELLSRPPLAQHLNYTVRGRVWAESSKIRGLFKQLLRDRSLVRVERAALVVQGTLNWSFLFVFVLNEGNDTLPSDQQDPRRHCGGRQEWVLSVHIQEN